MAQAQAAAAQGNAARSLAQWLRRHEAPLTVALFAVAMFYTRSWEGDLHGDPVHYAAVAKSILTTGDWLTMHDAPGLIYARKPPLMFWLVAVNFRLLGATAYAAKFWSCLFAAGSCLMVFFVGRRLFGPTAGLLAGCMLALCPGVIVNVIDLRLDSAVMLCAVVTVYAVVRAVDEERPRWLLLVGLAGGLGMMIKPVAGVHAVALTALLLAKRRPRWLLHPSLFGAAALAVAIWAPWHVLMIVRHGRDFWGSYFGEQMGARLTLGGHLAGNLGSNVTALLLRGLPWWPLGLYVLVRRGRLEPGGRWGVWVGLVWIAEVALLMAVPPKQYDRYVITAYPAIALLSGCGLSMLLPDRLRAAAPAILRWYCVIVVLMLATAPIKLHSYRCRGFVLARPLIDRLAPGPAIACHDPERPTGPLVAPKAWGIRSKAIYYLDRLVVNYSQPQELAEANQVFVIAKERHSDQLAAAGYERLLRLDKSHWLLWRSEAASGRLP